MKLRHVAAAGIAAALFVSPVAAGMAQAQAPLAGPMVPAAAPSSQATAAADWLAAQWKADPSAFSTGTLADSIISLAPTGLHADVLAEMDAALRADAKTYATNPGAAGKVAIAAIAVQALGADPTNYGGVDLIKIIQDGLVSKPDAGGMFNLPYAVIALVRAGETVPQASIDAFVTAQDASGAFGYLETWNSPVTFAIDVDSTGVAIAALVGLEASGQGGAAVSTALDKAITWAASAQQADGSWPGYSPANATAMVGQGLLAAGLDMSDAIAYLVAQQAKTGGAGLPNSPDGTEPDLMATSQALLLLAGENYLDAELQAPPSTTAPVSSPAPTTSAPTTSAPTTSTPAATTTPRPLPSTGTSDDTTLPVVLLAGVATTLVAAGAAARGRRNR
ncbi:prenyltransferase/squalene oxidase repeat-containing protein [Propionibacteriaceae bacterium G1746]|uniref:prenyltransferase/squalene oxidase repeat-containing protein n=1 Tax=Aestuariimicrobium sp. G57 TaxID=3418485 RepID=UPI003C256260